MNYYRLSILIATCVTLFGATPSYSQSQNLAVVANGNRTISQLPSYESYMQEGQRAIQAGLYQQALDKFQEALKLRPKDNYAKQAVEEAKISSYNNYMRQGYAASASKDYQTALKNFQQALKIKPQAFHALEAVRNINQYVKISDRGQNNNNRTNTSSTNILQANNRFLWLGLGITSAAVLIALFFFQKKLAPSPNLSSNKEQHYDNSTIINTQAQVVPSAPTVIATETPPSPREIITSGSIDLLEKDRPQETVSNNQLATTQVTPISQEQSKAITKLDVVTELVRELEHPSPAKRRKAIWELAQRADSRAMKPLVELMIEADSQERSLILEAVSQIASRTLKPMNKALAISLEDPNSQVRKNAIRDLTRVYDLMTQVSQRLSYSLDDPDNEVRETAKWALKQLNQLPSSVKLEDLGKENNI